MKTKYRPSNGTEGDAFISTYCENCKKYIVDEEIGTPKCDILGRSFWFDIDEPDYPSEWVRNEDGMPTCEAFEK